jgi:cyanophycinase-like exopeptidase
VDGYGWIVLVGGGNWRRGELDRIDARILSVINLDRPMIVLLASGPVAEAEAILEHYTLLGGPGGEAFTLDQMSRAQLSAPSFLKSLGEAGLLVLAGDNPLPLAQNLYLSPALEHIVRGFSTLQALTLVGIGGAASTLSRWAIGPAPNYLQAKGLGFLMNAVVAPHFTRTEDSILQHVPQELPDMLGLGIPDEAALALGPDGQVETWGLGQVTAVVKAEA